MEILNYADVENNILSIKKDPRTEVFNWGEDNAHPSLIEGLIGNSVTSKAVVDKVAKAIYGKSFGEAGSKVVNNNGQSLNEVLRIAAKEYAKQNNLFLWVGYDATLKINSLKVVSSKDVRLGKDDDKGYSGKFICYPNWDKSEGRKIMSEQFKIVDRYNPNKKVLETQIEAAGSITNYKGQIIHIQKDSMAKYSQSDLQTVLSEALLEANSQTFRSQGAKKGFLNTKILVVKPFASEEDRRGFKKNLNELQGAENSGKTLLLESANATGSLAEEFAMEDLSSKYQDKLFEYSDTQARKNIALAFGVPLGLIDVSDTSLFGNSGELLKQMKTILWEQQEESRDMIEEVFSMIGKNWTEEFPELTIISPFETEIVEPETNTEV